MLTGASALSHYRAYSISSAPDYRPDEVQLTVAVVQYNTKGKHGAPTAALLTPVGQIWRHVFS